MRLFHLAQFYATSANVEIAENEAFEIWTFAPWLQKLSLSKPTTPWALGRNQALFSSTDGRELLIQPW